MASQLSDQRPWHPYVFDTEQRRFVGDFEGMYRAEQEEGFDAWHQSDPRRLDNQVAALLLKRITFRTVLDLGCGKGAFTAGLKRRDNQVIGVDVSETAIQAAREKYPDIQWTCAAVLDYLAGAEPVDLIVARELLSYVEDWREVLRRCAALSRYVLVGLFIPPDPIGFVSSYEELEGELEHHFEVIECVDLRKRRLGTWLCESRTRPDSEGSG